MRALLTGFLGQLGWIAAALALAQSGAAQPAAAQAMDSTLDTRSGADLEWHGAWDRAAGTRGGGPVGVASQTALAAESFAVGKTFAWGAGVQYEEIEFSSSPSTPLPASFRSEGLGLDAVWRPDRMWGALVEALPAFSGQGAEPSGRSFNVTGTAEALWLPSEALMAEAGVQFDTLGRYAIYPCGGVVFGIGPAVSVQLLFPQPKIAYALNGNASLYFGANYEVESFRAGETFGNAFSRPQLNRAAFTAEEFSWGPGFTLRVRSAITFDVGAGVVSQRRFDFFRAGIAVEPRSAACLRASIVALF